MPPTQTLAWSCVFAARAMLGNLSAPTSERKSTPPNRVKLWDACEADSSRPKSVTAFDWKLAEVALAAQLKESEKPGA
jgi:hypothetical protein